MSSPYVVISVKYLDVIWTLRCKLVKCSPCSQITYEQAGVKTSSRTTWPTCSLLNNMDNKRTVWKTILRLAKHLLDPRWWVSDNWLCTSVQLRAGAASNDRGIDVVRDQIKMFAQQKVTLPEVVTRSSSSTTWTPWRRRSGGPRIAGSLERGLKGLFLNC